MGITMHRAVMTDITVGLGGMAISSLICRPRLLVQRKEDIDEYLLTTKYIYNMPWTRPRTIAHTLRTKVGRRLRIGVEKKKRTTAVGMRNDEKTVARSSDFKLGIIEATGTNMSPPGRPAGVVDIG